MQIRPKPLVWIAGVAACALALHVTPAYAGGDEREELAELLCELERDGDPGDARFDDFDLQLLKTLRLPNLFGIPGYRDLRIPVYRSEGDLGPGILLVHGNSSSARSYVHQIFSKLGQRVRLYLIDLPGFGRSEKIDPGVPLPPTPLGIPLGFPEYQLGLAEAVAAVAADPELSPKVFVGWSLGGNVLFAARGFGLLPDARALLVFGTAPGSANFPTTELPGLPPSLPGFPTLSILPSFGLGLELDPTAPLGFTLDGMFDDPVPPYAPPPIDASATVGEAYVRAFFRPSVRRNGNVPGFFFEDAFVRADPRARASIGSLSLIPPVPLPDEIDVLRGLAGDPSDPADDVPIAVLAGAGEAFLNVEYLRELAELGAFPTLWGGEILEVPAAGHAVHFERPSIFNRLLVELLIDVTGFDERSPAERCGGDDGRGRDDDRSDARDRDESDRESDRRDAERRDGERDSRDGGGSTRR